MVRSEAIRSGSLSRFEWFGSSEVLPYATLTPELDHAGWLVDVKGYGQGYGARTRPPAGNRRGSFRAYRSGEPGRT